MSIWLVVICTFLFRIVKFFLIFFIFYKIIGMIEKRSGKKLLLGIKMGGLLIVSGAVYDLFKLVDWDYYLFTFQGMSSQMIVVRYVLSFLWRFILLVVGLKLLQLNEKARKSIIVMAWVQIVTIFWKHPLSVFQHLALNIQQQTMPGTTELIHPWQPWVPFVFFSIFDLVISLVIIYYFSRSSIKEQYGTNS